MCVVELIPAILRSGPVSLCVELGRAAIVELNGAGISWCDGGRRTKKLLLCVVSCLPLIGLLDGGRDQNPRFYLQRAIS